jgi:DNA-binding IclR family transcriptional regulator
MRSFTPQTKQDPDALREEFAAIRMAGYAECVEEIEVGVSSVAAPIRIGNIGATFSIGATGPVRRFTARRREQIGKELCALSGKVALALQVHGTAQAG